MLLQNGQMSELNNLEALIIRSLDQTANATELKQLSNWINANDENKAEYYRIKDIWDTSYTCDIEAPETAWRAFEKQTVKPNKLRYISIELFKVAVVALLVFLGTYAVFNMSQGDKSDIQYAKVTVPKGSKSTVELPDGTIVKLNAGSELTYPSDFEKGIRKVSLVGEGYFNVKHNTQYPFMVSAGDIEVRVLGTEFNVMAYSEFNRIETTLVNGKVSLNIKDFEPKEGVILKPGQKAVFANGKLTVRKADVDIETNWVQNSFYFQNTSFEELIIRLEKWYDVNIVMDEAKFNDITFTGKFRNKETIWQVLDAIKITTPIDYHVKDQEIYITLIKDLPMR